MKKRSLFTLLSLSLLGLGGLSLGFIKEPTHVLSVKAEEEIVQVEETYTYEEDGVSATIILKENNVCTFIRNDHGVINEVTCTYSRDGNIVALHYMGDTLKITVYPETGTFGEYIEPVEVFESSVIIAECKDGTIVADKLEGHVGDIVTLTAKHDVFYLVKSVSVNGTELVEDEDISGKYTFKLVEGENRIEAKFVVDKELLGEMSVIMEQAKNKDWANLFSVDNIVRVVSFLFNGGILLAIVRYYVKDKKLENKLEKNVKDTVSKAVPEATKEIVTATIKELIMPVFTEMKLDSEETKNALTVFSRCFALAQENTPEARIAITQELSSLKLGDQASIAAVQKKLEDFMVEQQNNFANIMNKMQVMAENNKNIIAENESKKEKEEEAAEVKLYDGTAI